jgi:hypothetical protein
MGSRIHQHQISPGNTTYLSISMTAQVLGLRHDNGCFYIDIMGPDNTNDTMSRQFYLTNGSWDNVPYDCEKIKYCGSVMHTLSNCCSSCGHPTNNTAALSTIIHHLIEIVSNNPMAHVDDVTVQALTDISKELEKAKTLMQQRLNEALKAIKEHKEAFEKHIMTVIEAKDL